MIKNCLRNLKEVWKLIEDDSQATLFKLEQIKRTYIQEFQELYRNLIETLDKEGYLENSINYSYEDSLVEVVSAIFEDIEILKFTDIEDIDLNEINTNNSNKTDNNVTHIYIRNTFRSSSLYREKELGKKKTFKGSF